MPANKKQRRQGLTNGAAERAFPSILTDNAASARLSYLRDHHGYFTRRELGELRQAVHDPQPCPGEFDARGRLRDHCAERLS